MVPPRLLLIFVSTGVLLPIALVILLGAASLLAALGDIPTSQCIRTAAIVLGLVWGTDLACLVLALGVKAVSEDKRADRSP